jgi:ABC-type multidrug transport system fused ATPase/permease subunit
MPGNVSRKRDWENLKRLSLLIKPYRNWLILSSICAAAIGACDVISVSLITKLIDSILSGRRSMIFEIILSILVIVLVGIVASYLMTYSSGRVGSYVIRNLRNKIVQHFDNVEVSIKDKMNTGDTTSRLNNDISVDLSTVVAVVSLQKGVNFMFLNFGRFVAVGTAGSERIRCSIPRKNSFNYSSSTFYY